MAASLVRSRLPRLLQRTATFSTTSTPISTQPPHSTKPQRRLAYVAAGAVTGTVAVYRNDLKQLHFDIISAMGPIVRLLDAETAHLFGIQSAKLGFFPKESRPDPACLTTTVWGREFPNPIGVAAGFDKHAEVIEPLLALGFGFVEIGSVTPLPQPGNPKPRCFRLSEHKYVFFFFFNCLYMNIS